MLLSDFDYVLPPHLIAQRPLSSRDASRMLVLDRTSGALADRNFTDLPSLLRGDELIVVNNARVIPARLHGRSISPESHSNQPKLVPKPDLPAPPQPAPSSSEIEILLSRPLDNATWEALVRPGKKMHVGQRISLGAGELTAEVIARGNHGLRTLRFSSHDRTPIFDHLNRLGHLPLPPYIDRSDDPTDQERYQTVFARHPGAIAAPTAGLHFTPEILEELRARGLEICELTLNVGLGTFQPIRTESLEDHVMHAESYEIPADVAERVNRTKRAGRRILAIGTTVVRALEDSASRAATQGLSETLVPGNFETSIFITPGFDFRAVDALLTNFHLPRSTLLALVCAFAGREKILAAYHHAVQAGYRFYSYGDCMFINPSFES
ncbi:MAG: tRNA preQ1(34) S-adenosylmethionine ribosyltransferase-isomerase QueA [Acidobacteriota bacterium]|nr:tRNA preQ1(34) S-adenosylmethionine ribosyltransferase-isomerase QueA [Acidobacteriota bacterium]